MLRPWDLKIELSSTSGVSIYLQLAQKITEAIQLKRILPSAVMPGTRDLALKLGINRKTVIMAYDELIAQGWLITEKRRGTFVNHVLPETITQPQHSITSDALATASTKVLPEADQDTVVFNDGIPDTRQIPFNILSRAFRHALVTSSRANRLGYDSPKGMLPLRESICTMLKMERGMEIDVNNICTVRGSQMGVFVAARILLKSGDNVVLENFTNPSARKVFDSCGANIINVGQDADGMNLEALEQLCREVKVTAVYVTPYHQYPTTVTMNMDRRIRLLLLAEQYDFHVIEDDSDHEFHYSKKPMFPIASIDGSKRVIYIGSFSKVLAPAVRVGYVAASPDIVEKCAAEIMLIDRQGNSITELAVSELMDSGGIKRHILKTNKIYKERRDTLAELIRSELGEYVSFEVPKGGLAFWLRMKRDIDANSLMQRITAEKLDMLPGVFFSEGNSDLRGIRLGFGSLNTEEMEKGIARLKSVFASIV